MNEGNVKPTMNEKKFQQNFLGQMQKEKDDLTREIKELDRLKENRLKRLQQVETSIADVFKSLRS